MDNETTTKNLVAAIRERDQRIAAMTEALLAAADHEDAAVASAVLAERARWIAVLDVCGKPPVSDTEAMLLGAIRSAMGVR